MKNIIIYGSCYGTARKYAEMLGESTGFLVKSYTEAGNLNEFDRIIYVGSLYAGGVLGLSKTIKNCDSVQFKKLVVVTVGLSDPENIKNADNIKRSLKKQLSDDIYANAEIYHLRGGIDYEKLNFRHKMMMKLLYNQAKKIPVEKQDAETKSMIETYNQRVDFVDESSLKKITKNL